MAPLSLSKSWRVVNTHSDSYTGGRVRLSHCQTYLGTWCNESVKLLSIGNGQVQRTFSDEHDGFIAFDLHPCCGELATVQRSGMIRIWSTETGARIREWKGHKLPVTTIVYNGSGNLLATGAVDRCVKVWNAVKGFATHSFSEHHDMVTCLSFHPTALMVFSGSRDGSINAYNLTTNCTTPLSNHMSAITDMTIEPQGKFLISVARDQVINVWSTESLSHIRTMLAMEELEGVVVLSDESPLPCTRPPSPVLLTVGSSGAPRLWRLDTLFCIHEQKPLVSTPLTGAIARSKFDDCLIITGDHNIHQKSLDTFTDKKCIIGYNDEILDICCFKGEERAAIATNSELIRIMDLDSFHAQLLGGHTAVVLSLDISPCGKFLLSSSKDNTLRVWSLETMECITTVSGHTHSVNACSWSQKSSAFFCSVSEDHTLKQWGFDGQNVATPSTVVAHDKDINAVAIAPNDKMIATTSQDRTVKIWSAGGLEPLATLKGHKRGVWCAAFSPVDKCLATGSGDRMIKIWSLTDFSCVKTLEGHTSSVLRLSFLTKGMQLMSSGADALVKLWTLHTNECVSTFEDAHNDKIWAMAFTNTNGRLVTGGADSALHVWRDFTLEESEAKIALDHERVHVEQRLRNAIRGKKFAEAADHALRIESPRHLYNVFVAIQDDQIATVVESWSDDDLGKVMGWIQDWNTVAKRCAIAHKILRVILEGIDPERLSKLKNISRVADALTAYSQRHFERIDRLIRKTFLIDYTLHNIGQLAPIPEKLLETETVDDEVIRGSHDNHENPRNIADLAALGKRKSVPEELTKSQIRRRKKLKARATAATSS
uniref:U3 small nucleolar RNA-associated protein 13 C-terminal domain-containing protein n=1 Tax=Spongospora subterranea TaxID=70186 RepID=A0A0H5RA07_9EUKA|eukprot:CRZ10512.1 hypothetical protein [Spongospora subterranea]